MDQKNKKSEAKNNFIRVLELSKMYSLLKKESSAYDHKQHHIIESGMAKYEQFMDNFNKSSHVINDIHEDLRKCCNELGLQIK